MSNNENLNNDKGKKLPDNLVHHTSGTIVIKKIFCPNGHNLIDKDSPARFMGFPGISVHIEGEKTSGNLILSPIHGDYTKLGKSNFIAAEILKITCPECGVTFPKIQNCGCTPESNLIGLYLDENIKEGNQVVVCNSWGCVRSRIIDRFQILSRFE